MKHHRALNALERKFVIEATAGHFLVGYDDDGAPYAMGADRAGNLFSMAVEETEDVYKREAIYRLRD